MIAWRSLTSVVVSLLAAQLAAAQTYSLTETVTENGCFRIELKMELKGELRVLRDDKLVPIPLKATAAHEFAERVRGVGEQGLPEKTVRFYEAARAVIQVSDQSSERGLRKDRRLLVAQRHKDQPYVYSPAGSLTREELELTGDHFDTLTLTGLLPVQKVAVGDTWKVGSAVAQTLCHFEGLTEQDLVCKLEEVKNNTARVTVAGSANGIELGASVKLTIQAAYHFDLGSGRFVWLEWKQKDERQQGPVSPTASVDIITTLKRTVIEQPETLADVALVSVPADFKVPENMAQLLHRDPKARFDLFYSREWHLVSQTDEHLVLRLLDRGDFVAQATITPWARAEKGKHLSAEKFQEIVANTPGWVPDMELQAGEVPSGDGHWVYRVSALGTMDGTRVMQNFYLVAGPEGDQVVVLFQMTPKQAERLGTRDLSLVGSIDFPGVGKEKPKQP